MRRRSRKHCFGAEEVNQRIEQGFQFLACSSDAGFMMAEARRQFNMLKLNASPNAAGKSEVTTGIYA